MVLVSPNDVRVILIEGTANIGELSAALDMQTSARQAIAQDIPVVNNSTQQWVIKVRHRG